MKQNIITTGIGEFSKKKFNALVNIRENALDSLREALKAKGYSEVTTSSLVNIAGSCENPNASFTLNYYGREAHLSQSAQLQLEALVIRLKQGFFTINNSFREEHYEDPEASGRRLSEFTLIESEKPYKGLTPERALERIIEEETDVIKYATENVISKCQKDISLLGSNVAYLKKVIKSKFPIITYEEALNLLNKGKKYEFGVDFDIREEREILKHFNDTPTFIIYFPASIKFFNMKRTSNGKRVYSVDLLTPKLGETSGGAVREENSELILQYLKESKIGKYLINRGITPEAPFTEYINLFKEGKVVLRGGYGIGFERFVGFLIQSNDILNTIAYRTLHP